MICHKVLPLVDDVPYIIATGRWYAIHYYHWSMMCHTLLPLVDDMSYISTTGRWCVIHYYHWSMICHTMYISTAGRWCAIHYYHWLMICHTLVPLVDDVSYIITTGRWCLLKQTFWLDVRRNILLYYLQVGGYSAENFFEARSNFNEIMLLELFNQGIGLQVCFNTSNFCHGATFFCICQLPWILEHDWIFTY